MTATKRLLTGRSSEFEDSPGGSPLTTKGDIFVFSANDTRLPVGADGLLLAADSNAVTGLSWSDLTGDVRVQGMFASNVGTNGVGFIVNRLGFGRAAGYEWWQDGSPIWESGMDFVSTDLVLVCDIQPLTAQVHDVIRLKPGSGAVKMTYGVDAIPNPAHHLCILSSTLDNPATTQQLRVENIAESVNSKIPVYIKNGADTHMIMMENGPGDVWRVSAANPGGDPFIALGPSLSDGTGGNPTLFQLHGTGRIISTGSGGLGIGTSDTTFFVNLHGPSFADGASKFQLALSSTDAYNSATRGGGMWVSGEYASNHAMAGFGGVSVYKQNTADGDIATVVALCNRQNDVNQPIKERLRITGAGASFFGGAQTFSKSAGFVDGEIILDGGSSDTPGINFYRADNDSWNIDSANDTFRIGKNFYEAGAVAFGLMTNTGQFISGQGDNTGSLGKSGTRWADIFVTTTHIGDLCLDDETIDSHWTIREAKFHGEDPDQLYAINRRTFPWKKYRFQLQEAA